MTRYLLKKNTEWKTVEMNGEMVEIPKDWEISTFLNFLDFKNGSAFKPEEWHDAGIPIIRIQNLTSSEAKPNYYKGNRTNLISIKNGDYLFSWSGTIDIFKYSGPDAYLNQHIFKLVMKNGVMPYFIQLLKHNLKNINTNGLTMSHITMAELKLFQFYHSKEENNQTLISNLLSTQESLISDLESLLSKQKQRFSYLSEALLSGRLRVKENGGKFEIYKNPDDNWQTVEMNGEMVEIPKDWEVDKIANFTPLSKGASIPEVETNYEGKGLMYLKTTELWLESASKRVTSYAETGYTADQVKTENEYVISFDGFNREPGKGTVGLVTCEGEGIVSTSFFKVNPSPYYFFSVNSLKSFAFQKEITSHAEGSIALHAFKHYKNIEMARPKHNEEMVLISNFMAPQHELEKNFQKKLKEEKKKFNWLLEHLLSGKYLLMEND